MTENSAGKVGVLNGNTNFSKPQEVKEKKQCNKMKFWFFTLNNYTEDDIKEIVPKFNDICKRYNFQEEVGKEGTKHLQGTIELKVKMRWTEFKLNNKIHWEKTRNIDKAFEYCIKEDTKAGRVWIHPKPIKIISNLYPWQVEIRDLFLTEPDGRTCYWYFEEKGGAGKSSFCKYMYIKHKAITIQGGKLADVMNIIFNLDMNEVKMIIIDIPRNNGNNISYSSVECILNGMITNTKFETGVKVFNPPHVVCFANCLPDDSKLSRDRWVIKNISDYQA